jgi:hypothetical protein
MQPTNQLFQAGFWNQDAIWFTLHKMRNVQRRCSPKRILDWDPSEPTSQTGPAWEKVPQGSWRCVWTARQVWMKRMVPLEQHHDLLLKHNRSLFSDRW